MNRVISVVLLGLTAILFYFALAGSHGYLQLLRTREEITSLEEKSNELGREMRQLQNKIYAINHQPGAVEKQARE